MSIIVNNLIKLVQDNISLYVNSYSSLVVAFSGGLDSTVLLDIIVSIYETKNIIDNKKNFFKSVRAIHINHNLNSNSNNWVLHCKKECKNRNISLHVENVNIDKLSKKGIEAESRDIRYKVLFSLLLKNEILLTGHHQGDQVETFLLALKRGSGPLGLSGIKNYILPSDKRKIVRPLLNCKKKDIEIYAKEKRLLWIEDSSNRNIKFDRNFLRIEIIPLMSNRWPEFSISVERSAKLCLQQEKLLDELLEDTMRKVVKKDNSLSLEEMKKMSEIKKLAVIRRWLSICNVDRTSYKKVSLICNEIINSKLDSNPFLTINNKQIRKFKNHLHVTSSIIDIPENERLCFWDKKINNLNLPKNLGTLFRFTKKNNVYAPLTRVRSPSSEEEVLVRFGPIPNLGLLYISNRIHGRKLKKIWQELNIPPWKRKNIPLLFYNEKLIAAIGIFITIDGKVKKINNQWNLFWKQSNTN